MTNIVDTSNETVNAEFDAAERDIGTDEPTADNPSQAAQEAIDEAQRQAEIAMATGMIATSLQFSIGSFMGVCIEDSHYTKAAESYAILIVKYFPGGIFGLLDRWKEEIAATTATFALIRVVSVAKQKQREAEEAEQAQREAEALRKQQATQGFDFQEPTGEENHGTA